MLAVSVTGGPIRPKHTCSIGSVSVFLQDVRTYYMS